MQSVYEPATFSVDIVYRASCPHTDIFSPSDLQLNLGRI